jgi:predicted transcriptional regulator
VHLELDVQVKLARIAAERGRDAETVVKEAIEHFVDYDEWILREAEKGLVQIDSRRDSEPRRNWCAHRKIIGRRTAVLRPRLASAKPLEERY